MFSNNNNGLRIVWEYKSLNLLNRSPFNNLYKMNDRRKDIPIGCAVNIAIINDIAKNQTFKDACINVPLRFGIIPPQKNTPWPFFNISWGSYMMYSLFVVTKELYYLGNEDVFFHNLVKKNAMQDFNVIKEKYTFLKKPLYHFKSFRNAISHVNYAIDDNNIKLWDYYPGKSVQKDWHWEVEISNDKFMKFLGTINEAVFNLYNEINFGKRDQNGK